MRSFSTLSVCRPRQQLYLLARAHAGTQSNLSTTANSFFRPKGGHGTDRFFNRMFDLWTKPQTQDEMVKQHVPEVLEEGSAKKLELETTARDLTVLLGDQLVTLIKEQGVVSEVRRVLDRFLTGLNVPQGLITAESIEYLLHPGVKAPGETPNFLVSEFDHNLEKLVRAIEQGNKGPKSLTSVGSGADSDKDANLVKVLCALAMSNVHEGKLHEGVKCCSHAATITRDPARLAGVLALEAGIQNKLYNYTEAAALARKAIESSSVNSQAYLQGATALRQLGGRQEAAALLEQGLKAIPDMRRDELKKLQESMAQQQQLEEDSSKVNTALGASTTKERLQIT